MPRLESADLRDFSGGVNTRDDPLGLGRDELILSENMEPQAGGLGLKGRAGQALSRDITAISSVKSIFTWYKADATRVTVATGGTAIYDGESGSSRLSSLTDGLKWSMASWSTKNKAYYTNGTDTVKDDDGTTIGVLGGSPPTHELIEYHFDRLWLAEGSLARFSNLNADDGWPAASEINLSDRFGGTLKGMRSYGGNLIFLKNSGLYRFEGSPILGGALTRYSDIGCESKDSVVTSDFGIIYKALDGIYLTDGFTTQKISNSLDETLDTSLQSLVGGWYKKRRQYWASTRNSDNDLWVGTFIRKPVDQGGQLVVGWHKYTGFKAESFTSRDGGADAGEFYYGEVDDGRVIQADTTSQDVGTDYICKVRLRNEVFGDPSAEKYLRWFDVDMESTKVVTYNLYLNGRNIGGGSVEGSIAPAPTSTWNTGTWGDFVWNRNATIQTRTSTIKFKHGHYASLEFLNTGEGGSFRINNIQMHAVFKGKRTREMVSLNPLFRDM